MSAGTGGGDAAALPTKDPVPPVDAQTAFCQLSSARIQNLRTVLSVSEQAPHTHTLQNKKKRNRFSVGAHLARTRKRQPDAEVRNAPCRQSVRHAHARAQPHQWD